MRLPSRMKSQHWLFGLLATVSVSSVLYTALVDDLFGIGAERRVESQDAIETLSDDMKRLVKSVSDWQSFCQDPHAYLKSTSGQPFTITLLDEFKAEDLQNKSQIMRDAMMRCMKSKDDKVSSRLCMTISEARTDSPWFDNKHLIEMKFEFREGGSKLISNCESLASAKRLEIQSFFSAYTDHGPRRKAGRIAGGLRLPLPASANTDSARL